MKEKITQRIDFYEETISELVTQFNDAKDKYVKKFIRKQISQCEISINTLKELLSEVE